MGNHFTEVARKVHLLGSRTDNCVKNHFYSKLRKAIRKLNKAIHDFFKKEFFPMYYDSSYSSTSDLAFIPKSSGEP